MKMKQINEQMATPMTSLRELIPVDEFAIGGPSAYTFTKLYEIGQRIDGLWDAQPIAKGERSSNIYYPKYRALVTMPRLYVGGLDECNLWRRDSILEHYGKEA
jgi:hypothetical protein